MSYINPSHQTIKTALFGFGTVGQGVYQIIEDQHLPFQVVKICVQDSGKARNLPAHLFTYQAEEILSDPSVELIVEAISDAEAAFYIVSRSLSEGKQVVTANKKMIAEHLPELLEILNAHPEAQLRYEGAVGGAIPVLHLLEHYFAHEPIRELRGILNGSSNYILSKTGQEKRSYSQALQQAQQKGFAEADPTLDVSGQDAANKLSILALHAFGQYIPPSQIERQGITELSEVDFEKARQNNQKIKQVAHIRYDAYGELCLSVQAEWLEASDPLYTVDQEFNSVVVEGAFSGSQQFTGKGAGKLPTGTAVVADMLSLQEKRGYQRAKFNKKEKSVV